MLTLAAFALALGILIAIHEYGHYRVAVACGVKVLRFSVGFGYTLLHWKSKHSDTEFVLCALPLGGYVKMLDEREATVPESERHLAFNTQPLRSRLAIVAAGPLANLLLAVLLYAVANWMGVRVAAPILASPQPDSVAYQAGLVGGEQVLQAGFAGEDLQHVDSFDDVSWFLTRGALQGQDVRLALSLNGQGSERVLKTSEMDVGDADAKLLLKIGVTGPLSPPLVSDLVPGEAGARSGLQNGDLVRQIGAVPVVDGAQLRLLIRASVARGVAVPQIWKIERAGQLLELNILPDVRMESQTAVGRIGAYVGGAPQMLIVHYGPWDSLWRAVVHTGEMSVLTLRMMGKMLLGELSVKNLSGPLTIADYAGKSASLGLTAYLLFLALISVSLGVLNLLPLPVLDGGHLMYYLWEAIVGRAVSDAWMERMQRGGIAVLMLIMAIALFNDVTRLWG